MTSALGAFAASLDPDSFEQAASIVAAATRIAEIARMEFPLVLRETSSRPAFQVKLGALQSAISGVNGAFSP